MSFSADKQGENRNLQPRADALMRSLQLSRESLKRLLKTFDRLGRPVTVRDLVRSYGFFEWEIEEAKLLGWVQISIRKPAVGRPSRIAEKLSNPVAAKLPPWRHQIPEEITIRHWRFALESIGIVPTSGLFGFRLATQLEAYQKAFPDSRSKAGASASASRLMRRLDVRLMRQWLRSSIRGPMPNTVRELMEDLRRKLEK
jgi:hypothetical protein